MADMLRFWFDFGLDGLRMDAASGLAKEPGLPDFGFLADDLFMPVTWEGAPLWDVEGVHDILREWRAIADSYPGDRYYIGEVVVNGAERLARYMRPDELHTTFNLDFLKSPLEPERLRRTIDDTLAAFASVGAPPTWTLSNHDETRHVTRYGRAWTGVPLPPPWPFPEVDVALGTRRARAMLLLLLALPGSVFLYQGEELGLWEVEDLPDEHIHDPVWKSSGHRIRGRDGCRVPIPWSGDEPPFGFTAGTSWLPQPTAWRTASTRASPCAILLHHRRDGRGRVRAHRVGQRHDARGGHGGVDLPSPRQRHGPSDRAAPRSSRPEPAASLRTMHRVAVSGWWRPDPGGTSPRRSCRARRRGPARSARRRGRPWPAWSRRRGSLPDWHRCSRAACRSAATPTMWIEARLPGPK